MAEDALEVTPEGVIEGDIQGVLVDIQGTVKGNVIATRACRLGATARVNGEIRATNLSFSDGACFAGQVLVGEAGEGERADDGRFGRYFGRAQARWRDRSIGCRR